MAGGDEMTISEMAKLARISVRTLHYYDEIGLLKPSEINSETGYRLYDEESIVKLQQILFYKELDFSLKEIKVMMEADDYDINWALESQKNLLKLKRQRLDRLINLLTKQLEGEITMDFKEFDMKDIEVAKEKYAEEVKTRWGQSDAYKESQEKTAKYSKEDWAKISQEMDDLLKAFSEKVDCEASDPAVQGLVKKWQAFITSYYYECSDDILAGLGQMYGADERFIQNMDKFKMGTAMLISQAIEVYCGRE